MDGYEVKVWYSYDDKRYVAEIVELPGCAADGSTPEEALVALREVKAAWIAAAVSMGHQVPEPRRAAA